MAQTIMIIQNFGRYDAWLEAAWLKAIDAEVEAMVCCVCKWPNFAPGVCMLCGRKENLGKEAHQQ